jgi:hypothetical protein
MIGKDREQWIKIGVIAAIFVLVFFALPLALGQKPDTASALQYDLAKEVRIKGVVRRHGSPPDREDQRTILASRLQ